MTDPHLRPGRLRLVSYNIRKALGTDRRRNPGRICNVIAAMEPDIVVLQEADLRLGALHRDIGVRAVTALFVGDCRLDSGQLNLRFFDGAGFAGDAGLVGFAAGAIGDLEAAFGAFFGQDSRFQ